MSEDWYAVVDSDTLEQGDLILGCPVYRVETIADEAPDASVEVVEERHDVVVLTQSCDLENNKVEDVLVAAVHSYRALIERDGDRNPTVKSKRYRTGLVQGHLPAHFLLAKNAGPPQLEWSLADFHHLFTVPKRLLTRTAQTGGPRLRLVSPYREHLAQAFARYMMRVGLPTNLTEFESFTGI